MRKREADEPRLFDLPLTPVDHEEREIEAAGRVEPDAGHVAGELAAEGLAAGQLAEAEEPARPGSRSRGGSGHGPAADEGLPLFPDDREPETAAAPSTRGRSPRARTAREPEAAAAPSPALPDAGSPDRLAPRPLPQPAPEPPGYAPFDEDAAAGPRPAPRGPVPAPFSARLTAALADLGVHAAVAGAGWLGAHLLGARLDTADLPALAVYLLAFSFLYAVVSLAFWGRTPGMTAAGVVSRGPGGGPLTFGQTGLRWLAGVLTAALCGLPLLVALTGRSLADRLSGSRTLQYR
jgi:hypothetical protein